LSVVVDESNAVVQFCDGMTVRFDPRSTGSCQFMSIVDQYQVVCKKTLSHEDLRQQCVNFLKSNPYFINGDSETHAGNFVHAETDSVTDSTQQYEWESYLSNLTCQNTHGDNLTLQAMATLLNVRFLVASKSRSRTHIHLISPSNLNVEDVPLLFLGHYDEDEAEHYVSLSPSSAEQVTTLLARASDDAINRSKVREPVRQESSVYETECVFDNICTGDDAEQPSVTINSNSRPSGSDIAGKETNQTRWRRNTKQPHRWSSKTKLKNKKKAKVDAQAQGQTKAKKDVVAKRQRQFAWLIPTDGGALCKICVSYYASRLLPGDHPGVFVTKPFNNWKKSTGATEKNNKLLKHANSDNHRTAESFENHGFIMETTARTVYSMVHAQSVEEQRTKLNRIADFIEVAYYLYKNEIAHTTHYSSLLALIARLDSGHNIQRFMDMSPLNATYESHNTATEFLQAVSDWLTAGLLSRVRASPAIAVLADESTDVRTRNELSVCMRFLENGMAVETFIGLTQLKSTAAEDVKVAILTMLTEHKVPLDRIYWMAFDGASNMSGKKNGVQAKLKAEGLINGNYVHCRSHLLNLAAANVANAIKPLQTLLSALNSTWRFFHGSPKRHNRLVDMKKILDDPELELVSTGDTRWTSHYRAVKAVKLSLRSLVMTLQDIHCSSGDLSSEAGGLLLTFQNKTSIVLLYALEEILNPLYVLTLALQSTKLSLIDLPEKVSLLVYFID
jgi:hypothetical protein